MAEEQQKLRLNGMIDSESDSALFEALSGVPQRRRMGRLRQLALLGLLMERGTTPVSSHHSSPAPAYKAEAKPAKRMQNAEPVKPAVAPPIKESVLSVTAVQSGANEMPVKSSANKPKLSMALLDMIDTDIMK